MPAGSHRGLGQGGGHTGRAGSLTAGEPHGGVTMTVALRPWSAPGVHLAGPAPLGLVAARGGVSFAGIDLLRIVATGPGGHPADNPRRGNVLLAASCLADRLDAVVDGLTTDGTPCV
jgi:hypothetical protein